MVKLNKIYTRTGDDGTTGLVDGSRTPKHSLRIAAIGDIDEANSAIGVAAAAMAHDSLAAVLFRIQNDRIELGADLATPLGALGGADFEPSEMVLRIVPTQIAWLEQQIDELNDRLEPLTSFILPGGSVAAAHTHLARAISRRSERSVTALAASEPVNPAAAAYVNRLSDYLFVLARVLNDDGRADVKWVPGASR